MENRGVMDDPIRAARERVYDRVDLVDGLFVDSWWYGGYDIQYRFSIDPKMRTEDGLVIGYKAAMAWIDGFVAGRRKEREAQAGLCTNRIFFDEAGTETGSEGGAEEEGI